MIGRKGASMSRATFLTRVVLENYKSIARCDVRLGPLMYLVGPNGSGKSNFLDAIAFVAEALRTSVGGALMIRGGGGMICHAPNRAEGYFSIRLEFCGADGRSGHYSLKIGRPEANPGIAHWVLQEELLGIGGVELLGPHASRSSFLADRPALAFLADQPAYRQAYESLTRMRCYNIDPRSILDETPTESVGPLLSNGSNLAAAFFRLSFPSRELHERALEYLRIVLPSLREVRSVPVRYEGASTAASKNALIFMQRIGTRTEQIFLCSQMSTGTLRTLGILTALLQPTESGQPTLVAIEEPEAHVHPAVLAVLRDAMIEASYRNQILVATQSADLLDNKEVSVDSVLVFEANEGVTSISGIAEIDRDVIRRRLYTPGELMRIGQLEGEPHVNGSEDRLAPVGEPL
jgi:predicted ATPase